MTNTCEEVVIASDNEMDVSQESPEQSQQDTALNDSLNESNGSGKSDANEDNDMNDMNETIDMNVSNVSISSNDSKASPAQPKRKKRKLTPEERKKWLAEQERLKIERERLKAEKDAERERKALELKLKKDALEKERLDKLEQRKAEKEKREKERLEKEALKQKEKEDKQKEREEKLKEKEKQQKERDLEKQKKMEELMEKKKKIDEDKAKKEEERAKKEEDRLKKEEEKLKKNEKLEKQSSILKNFFIKKPMEDKTPVISQSIANGLFLPFQLCANQTIAPIVRDVAKHRFNRKVLDQLMATQECDRLYLESLRNGHYKPLKCLEKEEDEIEIIVEDESEDGSDNQNQSKKFRAKYLLFHENVRPAYRGTFRKKSSKIKPKQPFNKDDGLFEYEVDSDDEWEEEEPGELVDGSDSDGSVKGEDYEIDNDFFVPHGYLSEDENDENEEQNDNTGGDVEMADGSEQKGQKCRSLTKEQVLMAERNRSFSSSLLPSVIGCVWESDPNVNKKLLDALQAFKRVRISVK